MKKTSIALLALLSFVAVEANADINFKDVDGKVKTVDYPAGLFDATRFSVAKQKIAVALAKGIGLKEAGVPLAAFDLAWVSNGIPHTIQDDIGWQRVFKDLAKGTPGNLNVIWRAGSVPPRTSAKH